MKLPSLTFIVLDTETTGFIPKVNRIIEYADVRVEDGNIVNEYETLISIPTEVPETVQTITRIRPEDLEGKPVFEEVQDSILKRVEGDSIIVGQNISFDIRMLKGEGIDLSGRPWIDTSMLASLVFPELESYSLGYISKVLQLNHEPVHRAMGDVHATLELLSRCWERLLEIPDELLVPLRSIMERAPVGYQRFFGALPGATSDKNPVWLQGTGSRRQEAGKIDTSCILPPASSDSVQLIEMPLDPTALESIIAGAAADDTQTQWIAVKNIHALMRTIPLPKAAAALQPASSLLETEAVTVFAKQTEFTADEATLALKLAWYEPETKDDLPLHGGEKDVWNGKLACTYRSETYLKQFENLPSVILLNHWQLLSILADEDHPAHQMLREGTQVIIDDASMLEDTATRAYGYECCIEHLRAAAEGNEELTRFTDLLQIWMERTRQSNDVHYLTESDLSTPEVRAMREQVLSMLASTEETVLLYQLLKAVDESLNNEHLHDRICWIETRQNGAQYLSSVPKHIGELLAQRLYTRCATTLLIPRYSADQLREILPQSTQVELSSPFKEDANTPDMLFPEDMSVDDVLANPPGGASVILVSSRGRIENAYNKHAVAAEEKGVTLICQNMSGGKGRMQAEFCSADGDVIWIITPWTFETIELPTGSIDHLFIETMPFDHPSHTILSVRAESYRDAFNEY